MCVSLPVPVCVVCTCLCLGEHVCAHRYVCAPLHTRVLVWVFVVCPVYVSACGCVCARVRVHVCACEIVQWGISQAGKLCV